MNYKISLLALLLLNCSNSFSVDFNPENQCNAREVFCRTMADLKNHCTDASMVDSLETVGLEALQSDEECVERACQMARMMKENADCSFEMIMNSFSDVDSMKVMAAYALCQSCMADLMSTAETNC